MKMYAGEEDELMFNQRPILLNPYFKKQAKK